MIMVRVILVFRNYYVALAPLIFKKNGMVIGTETSLKAFSGRRNPGKTRCITARAELWKARPREGKLNCVRYVTSNYDFL